MGTGNGLNRLDVKTGHFTRYFHDPGSPDVVSAEPNNVVWPVIEDPTVPGVFWLASGNGLVRFEPQTGNHRRYLAGISIYDAALDPADPGVLWVATQKEGLVRLDTRTGQDVSYRHDPLDKKSLAAELAIGQVAKQEQRALDPSHNAEANTHAPGYCDLSGSAYPWIRGFVSGCPPPLAAASWAASWNV